jgi:hypothetical protein
MQLPEGVPHTPVGPHKAVMVLRVIAPGPATHALAEHEDPLCVVPHAACQAVALKEAPPKDCTLAGAPVQVTTGAAEWQQHSEVIIIIAVLMKLW